MAHPTPESLALVALGEEADPGVVSHVDGCRTCHADVESLQQVVAVGRSLGPDDHLSTPDPRVWDRIAAEVDADRLSAHRASVSVLARPVTQPATGTQPENASRNRRWAPLALAAAAALVVGLGGGYALRSAADADTDRAVTQLNALPAWPGASGTATLEDGTDGQRTLVVTVALPPTVAVDGTMEVWMSDTHARDMVAMGTMSGGSARFPVPSSFDITTHPVVDVSMEPRNDADPHHSDDSVVRGRLAV